MPQADIPIGKGSFENVEPFELGGAEHAVALKNLFINEAGSNVDRPALSPTSFANIGSYPIEALTFFDGQLFAITENDRRMWAIDSSGLVTDVTGTPLEETSRPVFASDGDYLAIAGGGAPRRWSGVGNTELLPGSPENCSHLAYLDGYWLNFLLADQELRLAGPTAATRDTWDANDFFSFEKRAGKLTSIIATDAGSELLAFKAQATQVFQNVGDSTTPFAPVFTIPRGTEAGYSIVEADNTLFWFDSISRRFVKLEGRNPVDIGTPFDRELKRFTTVNDCWVAAIEIQGMYLIAWTFPAERRVLVYDYKTQQWCEWDGFRDGQGLRFRMHSYCHAPQWNKHFVGDAITGIVWELSREFKTDGADTFRRLRRTGVIDRGTRCRNNFYDFYVKRGTTDSGAAEAVMQVRFKDDDKPWSDPITVALGNTGDKSGPVRVRSTGIYRQRQIEVKVTDPVDFILHRIVEDFEGLAH